MICYFSLAMLLVVSCKSTHPELIDFSSIWKNDTCGIHNYRIKIAPLIIYSREKIIDLPSSDIIKYFGQPDFIREDKLNYPGTWMYVYSTSSIDQVNGICGDPIVRSFSIFIHKESMKVIDVKEFIH